MTPDTTNKSQKRRDRPFPWVCGRCLKEEVYLDTMPYVAKLKHDGRDYSVEIPELKVPKCRACGEITFSNDTDDQITAALRSQLKLLTPQQIKARRKRLGLKAKELAEQLGTAAATVSRWEQGRLIQSRAMDNLLRLFFESKEARRLLRDRFASISAKPVYRIRGLRIKVESYGDVPFNLHAGVAIEELN